MLKKEALKLLILFLLTFVYTLFLAGSCFFVPEFQLESEMKMENIASDLLGSHPRVEASAPGYGDNVMLKHVNSTKNIMMVQDY